MRPQSGYYPYDNASSAGGTHYPPASAGTDAFPNPYGTGYPPQSPVPGVMAAGMGAGALGAAALNRGPTVSSTASSSYYSHSGYPPSHAPPGSPQFPQSHQQPMPVPSDPRTAKEREAFQRTQGGGGWTIANQGGDSPDQAGRGSVVVHQDGGRMNLPGEDEAPRDAEIPPTYDSIRHDDHGAPTPPVQATANN